MKLLFVGYIIGALTLVFYMNFPTNKHQEDTSPIGICKSKCSLYLNTNIRIGVGGLFTCSCDNN